ncbi:MAG: hypothetical protein IT435_12320 [Phycisphaerales bacterium]|nr:hypothetical protein [Phycisphaerales bacterium]
MNREFARNITLFAQLLAIGPLAAAALTFLRATDGGPVISPLINSTPLLGAIIAIAIIVIAAITGILDARFFGPRSGLAGAGLILLWASWRTGETGLLLTSSAKAPAMLAIEGALIGILTLLVIERIAIQAVHHASPSTSGSPAPLNPPDADALDALRFHALLRPSSLVAILAAILSGGLAAWLIAFHGAKGQTLFAAILAGIAAGAAAAIVSAGSGGSARPGNAKAGPADPVLSASAAMAILGILAPLAATIIHKGNLANAILTGNLFNPSHLGAFDWAAGALLGVPVGLGWAGAHAQGPETHSAPASS